MVAMLLAGEPVAAAVLERVQQRVASLAQRSVKVGLGVILVGDDPASAGYVRKKQETCETIGITSTRQHLPATASQAELLAEVDRLNADPAIDGFLIQHPVPS